MAEPTPTSDAQKKRAERLRAVIDGAKKPADAPQSPRELTDEAAREAEEKSGGGKDRG